MAGFEKERDRLDAMMSNRGARRGFPTPPAHRLRRKRGRSATAEPLVPGAMQRSFRRCFAEPGPYQAPAFERSRLCGAA